jgi:hypothetical protein
MGAMAACPASYDPPTLPPWKPYDKNQTAEITPCFIRWMSWRSITGRLNKYTARGQQPGFRIGSDRTGKQSAFFAS